MHDEATRDMRDGDAVLSCNSIAQFTEHCWGQREADRRVASCSESTPEVSRLNPLPHLSRLGCLFIPGRPHVCAVDVPESAHAPDNEYVRAGYEASFEVMSVDEAKHTLTHHVQGSITRDLLVGRNLPRVYQLTKDGDLIIRSADPNEHWSVTWAHY